MLNPQLFCDLFKISGLNVFRFALFKLCHEIFIGEDFNSTVHGIVFIFGYRHPFSFMLTMNENFLHIYRLVVIFR